MCQSSKWYLLMGLVKCICNGGAWIVHNKLIRNHTKANANTRMLWNWFIHQTSAFTSGPLRHTPAALSLPFRCSRHVACCCVLHGFRAGGEHTYTHTRKHKHTDKNNIIIQTQYKPFVDTYLHLTQYQIYPDNHNYIFRYSPATWKCKQYALPDYIHAGSSGNSIHV